MGEVYRADDMRLGQPVALKFLSPELESDDIARERLLAEVRLARTIAHPNVCRVYDIGDLQPIGNLPARTFLTMEYIDGEDLGSLLRRIGRLPSAKALDIARQLCAGLAAAHIKGVLHRDLKPANVMIDGRGQARIADFGIAIETALDGSSDSADRSSGNAGTLAYMAPELFMGEPASVRSDIYALGLVLYETVTGAPAYKVADPSEWVRVHATATPSDPSVLVADVDPAVERTILRCLEKDPAKRPVSAAQVAASLPGGDPLAAALAAGETPSPELVAASGEEGTLSRAKAWSALAAALVALGVAVWLSAGSIVLNHESLPLDTRALERRAQETVVSLGYTTPPTDWVGSWFARGADSVAGFQYRQSPVPLNDDAATTAILYRFQYAEDVTLQLDPRGHLRRLDAGGTKDYSDTTGARPVDWAPLLAAIGADAPPVPSDLRRWPPAYYADTRAAWTAVIDSVPSEVEAAALRGRIVSLRIRAVGAPVERAAPDGTGIPPGGLVSVVLVVIVALAFGAMARRNVRLGRGDRRGATRVAAGALIMLGAYNLLTSHWPSAAAYWLGHLVIVLLFPVMVAALIWCSYVAIEPYVRRRWPGLLTSWARLLEGRMRDGVVGQSLLAGVTLGALAQSLDAGRTLLLRSMHAGSYFFPPGWSRPAGLLASVVSSMGSAAIFIGVLVIARMLLRRDWAAWCAFAVVGFLLAWVSAIGPGWVADLYAIATAALIVGTLYRFGYMGLVVMGATGSILSAAPITLDPSRWYFWYAAPPLVFVLGLTIWGFVNVMGKQSLVPVDALDG